MFFFANFHFFSGTFSPVVRKTNYNFPICFLRFVFFIDCEKNCCSHLRTKSLSRLIIPIFFNFSSSEPRRFVTVSFSSLFWKTTVIFVLCKKKLHFLVGAFRRKTQTIVVTSFFKDQRTGRFYKFYKLALTLNRVTLLHCHLATTAFSRSDKQKDMGSSPAMTKNFCANFFSAL